MITYINKVIIIGMIVAQGYRLMKIIDYILFTTEISRLRIIHEWKEIVLTWSILKKRRKIESIFTFLLLYLCNVTALYLITILTSWKIIKALNIFLILIINCDVSYYKNSLYLLSLVHQEITKSSST